MILIEVKLHLMTRKLENKINVSPEIILAQKEQISTHILLQQGTIS